MLVVLTYSLSQKPIEGPQMACQKTLRIEYQPDQKSLSLVSLWSYSHRLSASGHKKNPSEKALLPFPFLSLI